MIGFGVIWGCFEVFLGVFWGGLEGSKSVCWTTIGHFLPLWKSCLAPDLVPNTTYWCNWPMLTGLALLTHFRTLGAPLGVPKAPLYEQIMPFCQSFEAQNGPKSGLLAPERSSDCPEWLDLVQNALSGWSPQVKCSSDPIFGILGLSWVQNGLFCSYNIPLGILRGTPKGTKMG